MANLGRSGERIDGRNQVEIWWYGDNRATVVAARTTVGETAHVAALALDLKVGPDDHATLAQDGEALDPAGPGSALSPDWQYDLVITGGTV